MSTQDTKFNYKILLAALLAVVIGILIAFYYSHARSKNKIDFLNDEKAILVKDLSFMKAEVDRLLVANEINDIEMQASKYKLQQLEDSIGTLNYDIAKLREYKKELRLMELRFDSLKLKNNSLRYNNSVLAQKYDETRTKMERLENKAVSLEEKEADLRRLNKRISEELRIKSYLRLEDPEGSAFRMRTSGGIQTNKASIVSRLKGCVTIQEDLNIIKEDKVLYLQFLDPNKAIIADNATTINVNGNTYSKKAVFVFRGEKIGVCESITIPEGSLPSGTYTLNVFENEKLLASSEFVLK
jgi:predicted RNase H-like nuclease (RuvC/YqgF family)